MSNKGWVLLDNSNTPFIIKGVCYSPIPIGKIPYNFNMFNDENKPWLQDGDLMDSMGVNTIRIYTSGSDPDSCKKFIRQMYKLYSINTVFPLPLDMHGVDFASQEELDKAKEKILDMVREYKDTPGILLWLVGNEIDYYFYDNRSNWETEEIEKLPSPYKRAIGRAEIIFQFVNNVIKEIHQIDDMHPVGISLGKTEFFNSIEDNLPHADFIGLNYYQARNFSSVWSFTKRIKMPILITEFGYDAYNTKKKEEDEKGQAKFIESMWKDIFKNTFYQNPHGICLGGMVFEWTDEWWKYDYGHPNEHDVTGTWPNAAWLDFTADEPNNVQEEWFGIFKVVRSKTNKIDTRKPRLIYDRLKKMWNNKVY
ncbi:MAG: hypothetical protein KKH98_15885 [Spirochaetes bacterium]|nr:hypothetical protein [Spirochaetota bacterium]